MSGELPVDLGGFSLMVTDEATVKMKQKKDGTEEVDTDYETGDPKYVVSLFKKPREAGASGKRGKGEEVKVTLSLEPAAIADGTYVELIAPKVGHFEIKEDGRITKSGLYFKANTMSPVS